MLKGFFFAVIPAKELLLLKGFCFAVIPAKELLLLKGFCFAVIPAKRIIIFKKFLLKGFCFAVISAKLTAFISVCANNAGIVACNKHLCKRNVAMLVFLKAPEPFGKRHNRLRYYALSEKFLFPTFAIT